MIPCPPASVQYSYWFSLLSGGRLNTERAAAVVLDEFRAGKVGKISLESPEV